MSIVLNGTSQYAKLASAVGMIFMSAWIKPTSVSGVHIIGGEGSSTVNAQTKVLFSNNTSLVIQDYTGTAASASISSAVATGSWMFVAGLWLSATSRTAFSPSTSASNSTSNTPTNLDTTFIGVEVYRNAGNPAVDDFFAGKIAQVGFWNADQSANIANLRLGYTPNHYPSGLVAYLPLNGDLTDTIGNSWSNVGSATFDTTDNPTMIGLGIPKNRLSGLGQLYVPSLEGV